MTRWKFNIIEALPEQIESRHVFFHPALIEAWMETYASLRKLTPLTVRASADGNEAYLPLVLWQRNWKNAFVKAIVPVGFSDFDYHNPIFKQQPSAEQLQEFWPGLLQFLKENFSFDTIEIEGITDAYAAGIDWQQGEICPQLNLADIHNEDELMAFFKTSLRGDLRRQMRRLSELGELRYTEYRSWDDIPAATFAEFMRRHSARWPNAYKAPHFHENLLRRGLAAGVVHFSTLSVGPVEIAWHLGFAYKGRFYYYMPAGHQDYFKHSPTKVHLFHLVKTAVEQGFEVFDHLRGEENYKSGWSNAHHHVNTLSIESHTMTSAIKHKALKIKGIITPPQITSCQSTACAA